jgi:hypothetical protein
MQPRALSNVEILKQTEHDSASPSGLCAVYHKCRDVGEYVCEFLRNDEPIGRVFVKVGEEQDGAKRLPSELKFDKHRLVSRYGKRQGIDTAAEQYEIAQAGYVRFSSSRSRDDYTIVMTNSSNPAATVVFDSRRLDAGDIFAAVLIRPGKYTISNTLSGSRGEIIVAYPVVGKEPYRPPVRLSVDSDRGGFSQTQISLKPAQELSVQIKVPSRITIELTEADDGPSLSSPVVKSTTKPVVGPSKPVVGPISEETARKIPGLRKPPLLRKKFEPPIQEGTPTITRERRRPPLRRRKRGPRK